MKIKLNKIIVIFSFVFAFSFITVDIGVIQHNNNKNASYIYMGIEKVSAGGIVEEVVGGFVDAVSNALGNVLNVVSGITQGTLSLITGGSFSDGYTQGFCSFDHYVESGSFLNPGDCEAAGGTVITKDKVLGGFCPANYPYTYEPSSYDINTCFKPCDAGTFSATAIAVYPNNCTPCPIGQYQSSAGQTSCVQCSEGSYQSLTGQTSCNPCPGGQYQSSVAQTSCVQCPSTYPYTKRIGATAQSQCYKICEAGTYNIGGRAFYQNNCIDCPIGKYQSLTGQTSCKYCPIGIDTTSPASRATNINQCIVDSDSNGLIDIKNITMFNNINNKLEGTSYKVINNGINYESSKGCPNNTCKGYELWSNIDLNNTADQERAGTPGVYANGVEDRGYYYGDVYIPSGDYGGGGFGRDYGGYGGYDDDRG